MKMTLRWYGSKFDTVTLQQIRQIPGVTGVISTLYDTAPGEVWKPEAIRALKEEVEAAGLELAGIESVNVHDEIKTGGPLRDQYIENYIRTLRYLGEEGIRLVCYNFMPVFDWTRTELARVRPDGSTVLAYTQDAVDSIKPEEMFNSISGDMNGTVMPGWEPERMAKVKELFELYKDIDDETLFDNLVYFLKAIMPVCNEYDIKMAIHPDDPAWSVFGLPRIIINKTNILRLMKAVDDVHNGVTFCSGSYGTNIKNDLPDMIRSLEGRIHFAHVRNLKFHTPTNFEEAAHLSSDGTFDMYEIMKALYDIGFTGPIRPDHGRMIWGEQAMPGYGLYDRALGATYLNGLWEAIGKQDEKKNRREGGGLTLCDEGLKERGAWEKAGYELPSFDREEMKAATAQSPRWIHFGSGNIFRAFQANLMQKLLNEKTETSGLLVAEGYDYEIIEKINRPFDHLSVLATLKADGSVEKTVVGSIADSYVLDASDEEEFEKLKRIFRNPSLQMASFTITEKGYALRDKNGDVYPVIAKDGKNGPQKPESYLGQVTALLYERYLAGSLPIAFVSMDNCSKNGDLLKAATTWFAQQWEENGCVQTGFADYVASSAKVTFPWSMIDKITPRPDETVQRMLSEDGLRDMDPIVTQKHTFVAPFVNAEECEYLVIEDAFPNGRPALDKVGVIFTKRETVNQIEKMKVGTCLNPLHTTLAVLGCLLGYEKICDEMENAQLRKLVERVGYTEGLPVVVNPGIMDPKEFIDTVVNVRIPNPFMPDTPWRIATDTSQKIAVRFGETIRSYMEDPSLSTDSLTGIPFVLAAWLRYLLGVNDAGESYEPSPDPMKERLTTALADIHVGETYTHEQIENVVGPLLRDKSIFGVDLYEAGLAGRVLADFETMLAGQGAVSRLLAERA